MAASVNDVERLERTGFGPEGSVMRASGNDCSLEEALRMGHLNSRDQRGRTISVAGKCFDHDRSMHTKRDHEDILAKHKFASGARGSRAFRQLDIPGEP